MGNDGSKYTGKPIGKYHDGRPIYEADRSMIQSQINLNLLRRVGEEGKVAPGVIPWIVIEEDGKQIAYSKQGSNDRWWGALSAERKQQVANAIAKTAKISAGIAMQAMNIAGDTLITSGTDAATAAITAAQPELGPIIAPVMGAVQIAAQNARRTLAERAQQRLYVGKTGMGELTDFAYRDLARNTHGAGEIAYNGGCECKSPSNVGKFIGSAEMDLTSVRDYANSLNAKTKERLIDDSINILAKLDIQGMSPAGTREEKLRKLLAAIPSGDKWKTSGDAHKRICAEIGRVINNTFGSAIINLELPPEVICQQVAEIISSFDVGMHSEFLSVYNDVRRALRNLSVLETTLDEAHRQLMDKIRSSDDTSLVNETANLSGVHDIILKEIRRQIAMLNGLLNANLTPADATLAGLLNSKKDLHGFIEKIDTKHGVKKFGEVITAIIRGMGLTANYAVIVDNALKTVGLTIDEYASATDFRKLRERLTQHLAEKKLPDDKLHDYLEAAELLYRNFYRAKEIAGVMKTGKHEGIMRVGRSGAYDGMGEFSGAHVDSFDGASYDDMDDNVQGAGEISGGSSDGVYPSTTLDKRIKDRQKLRNLIFHAFWNRLNDIFGEMVGALDVLSRKIGSEVPLSTELDGFRHIMQRINQDLIHHKGIYFALIGYYNDALSKSKKDEFMRDLRMISNYISSILEMEMYKSSSQYFRTVQDKIRAMIELIDSYSDQIAAKFGRGETAECPYVPEKTGSAQKSKRAGKEISFEPELKFKYRKSIIDAIRQFDYYYRVAQINHNLGRAGKEFEHYGEKYDKLVANSIADMLTRAKKQYESMHKHLAAQSIPATDTGVTGFGDKKEFDEQKGAALKMLDSQWEAKRKFWATVEAIDAYMRVFTNGIIKNPQDVKEIKNMLDDVEIISDWYLDRTGNEIASVFDYFPAHMNGHGLADKSSPLFTPTLGMPPKEYREVTMGDTDKHYYQTIADQVAACGTRFESAYPGNPYIVTMPQYGVAARAAAKKAFASLSILKNLLSVFIHIGGKFGGEELRKKVFMTPAQIYNNLVEYLCASAFCQGFNVELDDEIEKRTLAEGDSVKITWTADGSSANNNNGTDAFNMTYGNDEVVVGVAPIVNVPGATPYEIVVESERTAKLVLNGNDATKIAPDAEDAADGSRIVAVPTSITLGDTQKMQLFKKRYGVWMRSIIEGLRNKEGFGFKEEDFYFVICMKSIAAKIFTVIGMYDVLDRPHEYNGLSPIRMIVGGDDTAPKVDAAAVELYLRLPLLAQFYRKLFDFDGGDFRSYDGTPPDDGIKRSDKSMRISMVPDVDGVFAGLINVIFRKTSYVENNAYSDEDIKTIIREVNLVYQRMHEKSPQNTVMAAIDEFVEEINRRYGIVTQSERNKYESEYWHRYEYSVGDEDRYREMPAQTIAILPGEDEEEPERLSGAELLLGHTLDSATKQGIYNITRKHGELVYRFRCTLDRYFENTEEQYTFKQAIKMAQIKLGDEKRDEERFKIVATLLRGIDVYSKMDSAKYILFHETVVAGLNILSAIHTMLTRFQRTVLCLDVKVIQELIWKYLTSDPNTDDRTWDAMVAYVKAELCKSMGIDGIDDKGFVEDLIDNVFGRYEARAKNGGHPSGAPVDWEIRPFNGISPGTLRSGGASILKVSAVPPHLIWHDGYDGSLLHVLAEAKNVDNLKNKTESIKQARQLFTRFAFSSEFIMKKLVETLYGFGGDFQNLCSVKIEERNIYISYSGMKGLIEELFGQVSYFMEILRPHIDRSIMDMYVDKLRPGSYYWLYEQIMEKLVHGRDIRKTGDSISREYVSIDKLSQRLSRTYRWLTKKWSVDGSSLITGSPLVMRFDKKYERNAYDKVFAEMIFYDATKPGSGVIKSTIADAVEASTCKSTSPPQLIDYEHDPYETLHISGVGSEASIDTRFIARFKQLYTWGNEFTFNRSAMFAFNQLIAKYIQQLYDAPSRKIYANLLNQFANGAFNRNVVDFMYTYPDISPVLFLQYEGPGSRKIKPQWDARLLLGGAGPLNLDLFKEATKLVMLTAEDDDENTLMEFTKMASAARQIVKIKDTTGPVTVNVPEISFKYSMAALALSLVDVNNSIEKSGVEDDDTVRSATRFNYDYLLTSIKLMAPDKLNEEIFLDDTSCNQMTQQMVDAYNKLMQLINNWRGAYDVARAAGKSDADATTAAKAATGVDREPIRDKSWLVPLAYSELHKGNLGSLKGLDLLDLADEDEFIQVLGMLRDARPESTPNDLLIAIFVHYFTNFLLNGDIANRVYDADGLIDANEWANDEAVELFLDALKEVMVLADLASELNTQMQGLLVASKWKDVKKVIWKGKGNDLVAIFEHLIELPADGLIDILDNANNDMLRPRKMLKPSGPRVKQTGYCKMISDAAGDAYKYYSFWRNIVGYHGSSVSTESDLLPAVIKFINGSPIADILKSESSVGVIEFIGITAVLWGDATHPPGKSDRKSSTAVDSAIRALKANLIKMKKTPDIPQVFVEPKVKELKYLVRIAEMDQIEKRFAYDAQGIDDPSESTDYWVFARQENIKLDDVTDPALVNTIKQLGSGPVYNSAPNESDELANLLEFGNRWDPDKDHVLFSTLSVVLKTLIGSRVKGTAFAYLLDNITDVSLFMKERYRACLPIFRNLFKSLLNRCEFIKLFVSRDEVNMVRSFEHVTKPTHNPWPYVLLSPIDQSSLNCKIRFTGILDSIVRGCSAFISSCDQVLREIGDQDAKYLDLHQNFIKDYKAHYNMEPLMPMSSMLAVLRNTRQDNYMQHIPVQTISDDMFKLLYGARLLLGRPEIQPLMDHNPGFASIVDNYNAMLDKRENADKSHAETFMRAFVKLLRYVHEAKNIKGYLTTDVNDQYDLCINSSGGPPENNWYAQGLFTRADLIISVDEMKSSNVPRLTNSPSTSIYGSGPVYKLGNRVDATLVKYDNAMKDMIGKNSTNLIRPVYALSQPIEYTIRLTESSFKEDRIKDLVKYIVGYTKPKNPLDVQNIIDLNIVPINVHALMRDVPLANLYNYAYTFDRIIIELYYGLRDENARRMIAQLCADSTHTKYDQGIFDNITSAKDMLVALLLNPYMDVFVRGSHTKKPGDDDTVTMYDKYVRKMLAGVSDSTELARPKFISDQIYNKVVFGDLYASELEMNEMGPPTAEVAPTFTVDDATNILSTLIYNEMDSEQGSGGMIAAHLAVNTSDVGRLSVEVAKYVIARPRASLREMIQVIHKALKDAGYDASILPVAFCMALVAKLTGAVVIAMAKAINSGKLYTRDLVVKYGTTAVKLNARRKWFATGNPHYGLNVSSPDKIREYLDNTLPNSEVKQSIIDDIAKDAYAINELINLTGTSKTSTTAVNIANLLDDSLYGKMRPSRTNETIHRSLHYLDRRERVDDEIISHDVVPNEKVVAVAVEPISDILHSIGKLRFDTIFVRNLIFVVNLYRSVRVKLQRDLTYNKDVVTQSTPITRMDLTEFAGNQVHRNMSNYQTAQLYQRYRY